MTFGGMGSCCSAAVFAAQAAQFQHLFGDLTALVTQAALRLMFDGLRGFGHQLRDDLAAPRQQLCRQCVFERQQAAGFEPLAVAFDTRRQRLARRQREDA